MHTIRYDTIYYGIFRVDGVQVDDPFVLEEVLDEAERAAAAEEQARRTCTTTHSAHPLHPHTQERAAAAKE